MKINYSRLAFAIVLLIAVALYTVALLSLDYTFVGDGFSPFKTWSPIQTVYFAVSGAIFLSMLFLYNLRDQNTNLRGLIHTPVLFGLSFLILFSMDSHQVIQHLPYLQVLFFDDFGSLFLFGGLLALHLTYLLSVDSHSTLLTQNGFLEFGFRFILVAFCGSFLLGTVFYFGISICLTLGLTVFPFYGEGIIGSVLVVSVLLGLYFAARILKYLEGNELPSLRSIRPSQILIAIFEFAVVYVCTTAGFSIVGGLLTDGIPTPELIPFSLVILGFYAVIPFSVLLTHRKIFQKPSSDEERLE